MPSKKRNTAPKTAPKHLRAADLRGIAQLATQGTTGVTRIVEGVHQSVLGTLGIAPGNAPGQTRGLTGLIYKSIRGVTHLAGKSVDTALAALEPVLGQEHNSSEETPQRAAVLAALNGVLGDRLAAGNSPFATPMSLRHDGAALNWQAMPHIPPARGKVLLLIHGLCMNDLQWNTQQGEQASNHADVLSAALDASPVYVRYNTGLHISENGALLAQQLEQLVAHWPVPVKEIIVVAHSMGGLVIRSACHAAQHEKLRWPRALRSIVFLGTPHHGAPLERAGNWVDVLLGSTPYTKPFTQLAKLRSAGITDLRYGYVLSGDWQDHDRFRREPDTRTPVPLPKNVACYAVAATLAGKRGKLADRLLGDGLVPLQSALGQHDDAQRNLSFALEVQWIAYRTGHLQLLSSPEVARQMVDWLRQVKI
ncbi:MAG: esterase/lipase family protein [Burkholderiaceae bacterium]